MGTFGMVYLAWSVCSSHAPTADVGDNGRVLRECLLEAPSLEVLVGAGLALGGAAQHIRRRPSHLGMGLGRESRNRMFEN